MIVLPVLLAIVVWTPAVMGWGAVTGVVVPPELAAPVRGFLGLVALSVVATILSFVGPITPGVCAGVLALGWTAAALRWRTWACSLRLVDAWVMAGIAALCAAMAQNPGRHYDTGLYHLQAVRWMTEHGATRGLAALHVRLGFDSAWTPLAAILEVPGLEGRSAFVASALPLVLGAAVVTAGVRRLRGGGNVRGGLLLCALAPCLGLATWGAGSLYADYPLLVVGGVALVLLVEALDRTVPEEWLPPAALLAVFALTVKLSAALLTAGVLALAAWKGRRLRWRWTALWMAVAGVAWAARGIGLSGCLGYPSTLACLDLPWTTPAFIGNAQAADIASWARHPGVPRSALEEGWGWLRPWFLEHARFAWTWVVAGGLSMSALSVLLRRARVRPSLRAAAALALAGMVFWALTAPDPRLGLVYLVPVPALLLFDDLAERVRSGSLSRRGAMLRAAAATVLFFLAGAEQFVGAPRQQEFRVLSWPSFPAPRTEELETAGGLVIRVPIGSEQCWAAQPPCTPARELVPRLRAQGNALHLSP